jgi:hypothetical protein
MRNQVDSDGDRHNPGKVVGRRLNGLYEPQSRRHPGGGLRRHRREHSSRDCGLGGASRAQDGGWISGDYGHGSCVGRSAPCEPSYAPTGGASSPNFVHTRCRIVRRKTHRAQVEAGAASRSRRTGTPAFAETAAQAADRTRRSGAGSRAPAWKSDSPRRPGSMSCPGLHR